ncbi:dephospho-CoA kinase [Planctomycetota bacterium]
MKSVSPKPVIGIIGGIGSGKSTVALAFADLGCRIIDADALAHQILQEPVTAAQVIELLGDEIRDAQGQIDRSQIAAQVFRDPAALSALNQLIHPHVLAQCEALLAHYQADPTVAAVVLDMPLLIEVGWDNRCDHIVFVQCDQATREARAREKGIDKADFRTREKTQISLDKKQNRADNTLSNNSDVSAVVRQVTEIFQHL